MATRFNILAADAQAVAVLQRELDIPHFMAAVLVARGHDDPSRARAFLHPSIERDWLDPYQVAGLSDAVDALERAVRDDLRITVFGDFDLDGISSTTVLTRALRALGAKAEPFIPRRTDEGYGITEAAIPRVMETEPEVLVTVDCGIACKNEVKTLQHHGVEVVITDHHEPADLVPESVPVCDPKLDSKSPSSILAGVGVACKVVQALGARFGKPHLWREYTDLATLGTVADLMPMRAGNRALVADGVARMNESPRPCLAALLQQAGAADKPVEASSLSFSLIPRLNAAGRMGDAQLALDLLMCDDYDEACRLAARLEEVNCQRRAIEAELAEIASLQAEEAYHGQRALVVSGEGWHEGVKGIVASRLVRTYGVPALLFTIDENGEARGSGRSVGNVNLFRAVESCADLLTRFGGHEAAVGVTLPADRLPEFTERLCSYMDGLPEECFHPRVEIDACVRLEELTMSNVEALQQMAPFGQENRPPRFLARNVILGRCRAVGADKNHLSCQLTDGRAQVAGIMFHCSDIASLMQCDSVVDAAFEVQIDEYRGRRSVKAMLSQLAPATPCAALEACLQPDNVNFVSDLYAASDAELCADCSECASDIARDERECEKNRACWEKRAAEDPAGLQDAVIAACIGEEGTLFDSQRRVLDALGSDRSVLAVMATGRGKSLTFQVHAACRALAGGGVSLFVYPLRALIADQAYHLDRALSPFGVVSEVLTGESTPDQRRSVFARIAEGGVDIVLTTPEFLSFHADEFAQSGNIDFMVVDEAHHIGLAKAGNRTAYARISQAVERLAPRKVLALTATASAEVADDVCEALGIVERICDDTSRPNLSIDDQRNSRRRETYLANLVATGEKTVIYVNSRQQSVSLARALRKQVPQMASMVGFYNAGLARVERTRIEELFRADDLRVLVATSAFGEGVDIPNIRHVVLYHLPFNEVEFNQMSGRVGRDGLPAQVHLLFGADDARINEGILQDATPSHDAMAQVYRRLRDLQRSGSNEPLCISNADLARSCSEAEPKHPIKPASAACAVSVFRELGLIETRSNAPGEDGAARTIHVNDDPPKVELTDSVRYREGQDEIEIFRAFRQWVLSGDAEELRRRVSRPILPTDECPPAQGEGDR